MLCSMSGQLSLVVLCEGEEGRQGLKLEPLDKLYPKWAEEMRRAMK